MNSIIKVTVLLMLTSLSFGYTLEEAIDVALQQRGDVAVASSSLESARWDRNAAHTWFLPTVNFNAGYQNDQDIYELEIAGMGSIPIETEWASSYGISATVPIVMQGPAGASMSSTALNLAEYSLAAAKQDAAESVISSFYAVLLAEMMNEVAVEAMEIAREGYSLTAIRYETGMASRFELLQSQVAYENRRPDSIAAATALVNSRAAFAVSLGYSESEQIPVEGDLLDVLPVALPATIEEARSLMASSSMELATAVSLRELGDDGVSLAAASFAPALILKSEYSFEAAVNDFSDLDADAYERNWVTSAAVQVPLFHGISDYSSYQSARYDRLAYQAQATEIEHYTSLGLVAAWNSLSEARETVAAAASTVGQAEEGAEIARISYEAGMINRLEMDGAFLALTLARTNYASALYALRTAEASLARTIGVLSL